MALIKPKTAQNVTKSSNSTKSLAAALGASQAAPRYANGGRIPDNADLKENYKPSKLLKRRK